MGALEDRFRYQPPKRGSGEIAALWRGQVTDVRSDGRVRARISALGQMSLGPMICYVGGVGVGDQVLIGAIGGQYADLSVIGFADGRVPLSGNTGRLLLASETPTAAKTILSLQNVDNTPDATKPISAATATALAGKAALSHTHLWADLTDKPATFPAAAHTHLWADITDKPATFAPTIGTTATTAKAGNWFPAWTEVTGKPATFAPSAHTHLWADLTDKPATFPPSAHTHLWADITDKPATFAPSAHTHAAADVTTGVFAPALLPTATTTVQGAMSAADKVKVDANSTKLDASTALATPSTLALRDAAGRFAAATPAATGDVATKGYVDGKDANFLWRKMEWSSSGFSVNGGASWDVGPLGLRTGTSGLNQNKNVGAAFASSSGSLSGAVNMTEEGFYLIDGFTVCASGDPGGAWLRIVLTHGGADGFQEVLTQAPNHALNGQFSIEFECHVSMPVPVYLRAGDEIRLTYLAQNNHTVNGFLRMAKVGNMAAWGL